MPVFKPLILLSLATTFVASSAKGVILYRSATPNSTAPTGTLSAAGWQYQMKVGGFTGTPIGPNTFLTANHIRPGNGTTFVWNGETYTVTGSGGGVADMAIVRVNKIFPSFAPVYSEATDGSLIGKQLVVYGRGIPRGAEVHLSTAPRPGESTLRGWAWDTSPAADTKTLTWGTNVVDFYYDDTGGSAKKFLLFDFDRNGLSEESTVSAGDSGGGLFVQGAGGIWKLAATNYGVESNYRRTTTETPFGAAVFDKGNLYQYIPSNGTNYYNSDDISDLPAYAFATNITNYLTTLAPFIPKPGDANHDGKVNTVDFNLFADNFGVNSFDWADGDFNHDGQVNSVDFNLYRANYGFIGTPATASTLSVGVIPEPASGLLLAAGLAVCLRRNRR